MPHENDIAKIFAGNLVDNIFDVGLLAGGHALLLGEAGQRQRVGTVAGRTQRRRHLIPSPRSEPGAWHEYEFRHGGNLVRPREAPVLRRAISAARSPSRLRV